MSYIKQAITFARDAHSDQVRKYTLEPYLTHPMAVAGLVAAAMGSEEMIVAAILHDTVEDNENVSIEQVKYSFGGIVAGYVSDLTDVSVHSDGNRATRVAIDREHTAKASPEAKTIKLGDVIDNLKSVQIFDPKFAARYVREKNQLLGVLKEGNAELYWIAYTLVSEYLAKNPRYEK